MPIKLLFNLRFIFAVGMLLTLSVNLYAYDKNSITIDKGSNDYSPKSFDSGKNSYTYSNTVATSSYNVIKSDFNPSVINSSTVLNNNNYATYLPAANTFNYSTGLNNNPAGIVKLPDSNSIPAGVVSTAGIDKNSLSYAPKIDSLSYASHVGLTKGADFNIAPSLAVNSTVSFDKNSYNYAPKIDTLSHGPDIIAPVQGMAKVVDLNSVPKVAADYPVSFDKNNYSYAPKIDSSGYGGDSFIDQPVLTKISDLNSIPDIAAGSPAGIDKNSFYYVPKYDSFSDNSRSFLESAKFPDNYDVGPDVILPAIAKSADLNSLGKAEAYATSPKQQIPARGFWYPQTKNDLVTSNEPIQTGLNSQLPDYRESRIFYKGIPDTLPNLRPSEESRLLRIILDPSISNPIQSINASKADLDLSNDLSKEGRLNPVSLSGLLINLIINPRLGQPIDIPRKAAQALLRMRELYPEAREYLDAVWPNQGQDNQKITLDRYSELLDHLANGLGVSPQALKNAKNSIPLYYIAATPDNIADSSGVRVPTISNDISNSELLVRAIRGNPPETTTGRFQAPYSSDAGGIYMIQRGDAEAHFSNTFAAEAGHALLFSELGHNPESYMAGEAADLAARLYVADSLGYANIVEGDIYGRANDSGGSQHSQAAFAVNSLIKSKYNYTPSQVARAVFQTVLSHSEETDPNKLSAYFLDTAQDLYPDQSISR